MRGSCSQVNKAGSLEEIKEDEIKGLAVILLRNFNRTHSPVNVLLFMKIHTMRPVPQRAHAIVMENAVNMNNSP